MHQFMPVTQPLDTDEIVKAFLGHQNGATLKVPLSKGPHFNGPESDLYHEEDVRVTGICHHEQDGGMVIFGTCLGWRSANKKNPVKCVIFIHADFAKFVYLNTEEQWIKTVSEHPFGLGDPADGLDYAAWASKVEPADSE